MDDFDIPIKKISDKKIPFEVLKYVPYESALNYLFLPVAFLNGVLEVGMVDPDNIEARDALQFIASKTRIPYKVFLISKKDFDEAIKSYQGISADQVGVVGDIQTDIRAAERTIAELTGKGDGAAEKKGSANIVEEAPITKIVSVIIQNALSGGASDIHIEPSRTTIKVRFRVDGVLYTSLTPPMPVHEAMISRKS